MVALVAGLCVQKPEGIEPTPLQPAEELKLSDFPEAFKDSTLIVVGDNASDIEMQAVNEIAEYLENETGNKPLIKKHSEISDEDKRNYNLIVVGTPKTNPFLEEVYALTNATKVTEEFPGEGKGVLEILRNPWDESKAMLLVEGSDEWGVKGAENSLLEPMKINVKKKSLIASYTLNEEEMGEIIELAKQYLLSNNIKVFSFKSVEKINLNIEGPAKEILTESFPNLPLYINNTVWEVRWQGEKEEYIIIIDPKSKDVVCGYRSIKMAAPGIMPLKGGVQ